jgi:hypothetical protein
MPPPFLTKTLPCTLTARAGVATSVHTLLDRNVVNGQSFADFGDSIAECTALRTQRTLLQCLGVHAQLKPRGPMDRFVTSSSQPHSQPALVAPAPDLPPTQPAGGQPTSSGPLLPAPAELGTNKSTPSGAYFAGIYRSSHESATCRELYQRILSSTSAFRNVLKFDHCHKPAKSMQQVRGCQGE